MKAKCIYALYGDNIVCMLTKQLCGNVKYCRSEKRWKLSENAVNCPIPKKEKANGRKTDQSHSL